eukprot:TRINITY_DN9469_c0_g1_i1.p1 TRINITY_DN9469_c0_g1~~TRINITY_DN9469_c0_g1_i1.p1  ORF type:complete len:467 (-),score=44.14 TRINITY_DN9469_c0_g1_i1:308-1708(-)
MGTFANVCVIPPSLSAPKCSRPCPSTAASNSLCLYFAEGLHRGDRNYCKIRRGYRKKRFSALLKVGGTKDGAALSHLWFFGCSSPLRSPNCGPVDRKTRHSSPSIVCMAPHKGRVGTYKREGNISLASFGIKAKRDTNGKTLNLTKSLSKLLPYVVVATAVAALTHPASFAWVSKDYYAPALGGIMLSIGVQLSLSDFAMVFQRPLPILIGYTGQYVVKPLLGYGVARAFNVSPAFAAGLILTSCVAGAQLSSYAVLLSGGDVALSIVLTSLTTMTSVVVTPLLSLLLIGSVVPVDIIAMGKSIWQVVICPVMLGLLLNTYAPSFVDLIRPFMPLVAMVCTSLCIGSPLALNRDQVVSTEGLRLLAPVLAFHVAAFFMGYVIAKLPLWRREERVARTISLCTGMQSSTLAMLLATQFLGKSHAVPPACSVVVMAVAGLSLASYWGRSKKTSAQPKKVGTMYRYQLY